MAGPRLKRKLQAEIAARLDEMAMPANEVLARLGEMARADISDFIEEGGAIDWKKVKAKGCLVKRITHTKGKRSVIELHDAQAALTHLDKYHGDEGKPLPDRMEVKLTEVVVEHPSEPLEDRK